MNNYVTDLDLLSCFDRSRYVEVIVRCRSGVSMQVDRVLDSLAFVD